MLKKYKEENSLFQIDRTRLPKPLTDFDHVTHPVFITAILMMLIVAFSQLHLDIML